MTPARFHDHLVSRFRKTHHANTSVGFATTDQRLCAPVTVNTSLISRPTTRSVFHPAGSAHTIFVVNRRTILLSTIGFHICYEGIIKTYFPRFSSWKPSSAAGAKYSEATCNAFIFARCVNCPGVLGLRIVLLFPRAILYPFAPAYIVMFANDFSLLPIQMI